VKFLSQLCLQTSGGTVWGNHPYSYERNQQDVTIQDIL